MMRYITPYRLGVCLVAVLGVAVLVTRVPFPRPISSLKEPAVHETTHTEQLTSDRIITTASGTTFEAAKSWFVGERDGMILLEDPDRELVLVVSENQEPTAEQAAAYAWRHYEPQFNRTVDQIIPGLAQDGWDEVAQVAYEVKADESRVIFAVSRRKGQTWYVTLLDSPSAAYSRRRAQIATVLTSLKAPGIQEESWAGRKAVQLDAERLKKFETFFEAARVAGSVPGAAVAIVQDGKVVFAKGFGVKELGVQDPVTPETLFMIGSSTKSFTTLMMARLIDEGLFTWDTPVTQLMPSFELASPEITQQLTMQHTVSASTGMPRQDMEFFFKCAQATPESRVAQMRTMRPTTRLGETFQYSNPLVSAGGYIAAHARYPELSLGHAYDRAMQTYVFDPLHMKSTTFDLATVERADHALPHTVDLLNRITAFAPEQEMQWVRAIRPAGGAWSNVHDMAQYLLAELGGAMSPAALKRREPQVKMTDKIRYGLGFLVEDDHSVTLIGHGGNTSGFTADMFFLPDHQVGMVVLTNIVGKNPLREVAKRYLLELLFDAQPQAHDMLRLLLDQLEAVRVKQVEQISFAPDRVWVEQLAGTYAHETLGSFAIRVADAGALLDTGEWSCHLGQKREHDGTVLPVIVDGLFSGFTLLPGSSARGHQTLTLDVGQQKYVFERVSE